MDTYPCSCVGENPNCFKCSGTGLVRTKAGLLGRPKANLAEVVAKPPTPLSDASPQADLTARKHRREARELGKGQPFKAVAPKTSCPICFALIKTGSLAEHRRRAHSTPSGLKPAQPSSPMQRGIAPREKHDCPLCKKSVTRLEVHFKEAHLANLHPKEREVVKTAVRTLACPKCEVVTETTTQMFEHLLNGHGYRARMLESRRVNDGHSRSGGAGAGAKNANGRNQRKGTRSASDAVWDPSRFSERAEPKVLDAKLGWGGSFRDAGQFGSYPSHDAMDDESSA